VDIEIGGFKLVIVLGVRHGGLEHLIHVSRRVLRHKLQNGQRLGRFATTDGIDHQAHLTG
jgi:hypothetical protein